MTAQPTPGAGLLEPTLNCRNKPYSNRPDLVEQLHKVTVILADGVQGDGDGAEVTEDSVVCSRRLRDRFSPEDLWTMIDLYRSGITAKQVAERFGVSLRSAEPVIIIRGFLSKFQSVITGLGPVLFRICERRSGSNWGEFGGRG